MENKKTISKKKTEVSEAEHEPDFFKHAKSLGHEVKQPPLKFKSFALLFFQDSIQNINEELNHLKAMRKHHMGVLRKLLPMSDENIVKHFSEIPEMMQAYEDLLKESDLEVPRGTNSK